MLTRERTLGWPLHRAGRQSADEWGRRACGPAPSECLRALPPHRLQHTHTHTAVCPPPAAALLPRPDGRAQHVVALRQVHGRRATPSITTPHHPTECLADTSTHHPKLAARRCVFGWWCCQSSCVQLFARRHPSPLHTTHHPLHTTQLHRVCQIMSLGRLLGYRNVVHRCRYL
jgi:hypothetical protein